MFCNGIVEEMDNAHIVCLLHFDTIGYCMEEGHGKEKAIDRGRRWKEGGARLEG